MCCITVQFLMQPRQRRQMLLFWESWMPFLPPNQQRRSTKGTKVTECIAQQKQKNDNKNGKITNGKASSVF